MLFPTEQINQTRRLAISILQIVGWGQGQTQIFKNPASEALTYIDKVCAGQAILLAARILTGEALKASNVALRLYGATLDAIREELPDTRGFINWQDEHGRTLDEVINVLTPRELTSAQ